MTINAPSSNRFNERTRLVLDFVIAAAQRYGHPNRVILFGSRARGDGRPTSDYDIAVDPDANLAKNWARFWLDVDEEAPTLCSIDLVCLDDSLSPGLRLAIESEGLVFAGTSNGNEP